MDNAKIYIESNSVKLSEHSGDYEAVSKYRTLKALEMQEQSYARHGLTVNLDDLLEYREIIIVKMKFNMYHYAIGTHSQIDGKQYLRKDDEFYQTDKEVTKWQKIND